MRRVAVPWVPLVALVAALVSGSLIASAGRATAARARNNAAMLPGEDTLVTGRKLTEPPIGSPGSLVPGPNPVAPVPVGSFPANMVLHPSGQFVATSAHGYCAQLTSIAAGSGAVVGTLAFPGCVTPSNITPPALYSQFVTLLPGIQQPWNFEGLYYGLAAGPPLAGMAASSSTLYVARGLANSIAAIEWTNTGNLIDRGLLISTNSSDAIKNPLLNWPRSAWPAGLALDPIPSQSGGPFLFVTGMNPVFGLIDLAAGNLWQPSTLTTYSTKAISPKKVVAPAGSFSFTNQTSKSETNTSSYPLAVTAYATAADLAANQSRVYVASERDASVYSFLVGAPKPARAVTLLKQIGVGSHPDALTLEPANSWLLVANAHSDSVSVVDVNPASATYNQVLSTFLVMPAGARNVPGATPTDIVVGPGVSTGAGADVYVALADLNAVGVFHLKAAVVGGKASVDTTFQGYIPVGWYPTSLAISGDGSVLLVANGNGSTLRTSNPKFTPVPVPPVPCSPQLACEPFCNPNYQPTAQPPIPHDSFSSPVENPYYVYNAIGGNVQRVPLPAALANLGELTEVVIANNQIATLENPAPNPLAPIGYGAGGIQHIIYIVKENRSFDSVFGDINQYLPGGGAVADPSLCLFPGTLPPSAAAINCQTAGITPNQHLLALQFALFDNFYCNGPVSGEGWTWVTQGMANEWVIRNMPYINRSPDNVPGPYYWPKVAKDSKAEVNNPAYIGSLIFSLNYNSEGQNNGYPVGGFPAKDVDGNTLVSNFPNGLPPIPNIAEAPGGYIWDNILGKKNLGGQPLYSLRNYGFFFSVDPAAGQLPFGYTPFVPDNFPSVQALQPPGHYPPLPANPPRSWGMSDYDFRRLDLDYADSEAGLIYSNGGTTCQPPVTGGSYLSSVKTYGAYGMPSRFSEWNREFQRMAGNPLAPATNAMPVPNFMTIRLPRNHSQGLTPSTSTSPIHSPCAMVGDNDYAVGQIVQAVTNSPIWPHAAIFIVEDDAQFGPDHVDAHRSPCLIISPYIKRGVLDHTFYNNNSVLRTIELLLDLEPMNQYDATAAPIVEPWDLSGGPAPPNLATRYTAILPSAAVMGQINPTLATLQLSRDPRLSLAKRSQRMNFRVADKAPALELNDVIWKSIRGMRSAPPPPRFNQIASLERAGRTGGLEYFEDDDDEDERSSARHSERGAARRVRAREDDDD
jgi:hypothetical protein